MFINQFRGQLGALSPHRAQGGVNADSSFPVHNGLAAESPRDTPLCKFSRVLVILIVLRSAFAPLCILTLWPTPDVHRGVVLFHSHKALSLMGHERGFASKAHTCANT